MKTLRSKLEIILLSVLLALSLSCVLNHLPQKKQCGILSSFSSATHPDTGVSIHAPFLCVETRKSAPGNMFATVTTNGYFADDASIGGHKLYQNWHLQREIGLKFESRLQPLPLNRDKLNIPEGQINGNTFTLFMSDGSTVQHSFSYLPQDTPVYYIGRISDDKLYIFRYETELYNKAAAIAPTAESLDKSYVFYHGRYRDFYLALGTVSSLLLSALLAAMLLHRKTQEKES